jgi:hypothetical protein
MGVALVAFALFAWSLRLQQGRSLDVRDPDGLIGPAELVEMAELGVTRSIDDGPFVQDGRLGVVVGTNGCPMVRVDARDAGTGTRLELRARGGRDCDDQYVEWVVLITPEDPLLLEHPIEIVPLGGEAPPSRPNAPFGTWSPPYPSSSTG